MWAMDFPRTYPLDAVTAATQPTSPIKQVAMYSLLNVYDCPKCGKVLSDEIEYIPVQVADDEWDKLPFCNKCNSEVTQRVSYDIKTHQEMPHLEEVDDERARWANGFYDDIINQDYI